MGPSFGWIAAPSPYKQFFDILPLQDTREHILVTGKCWCRPGLDEDGDFVHNAADGRERYEQQRARPH